MSKLQTAVGSGVLVTGTESVAFAALPGATLGLRWLALAAVAAAAALVPGISRIPVVAIGIATSALIALVQSGATQRGMRSLAASLVLLQVGLWTCLALATGGPRSPVLVAYVLEIPLSGFLLGYRGVGFAAVASVVACLTMLALTRGADAAAVVVVLGFIGVASILALQLIGLGQRQQRAVDAAHDLVRARADHLATELRLLGEYVHDALLGIDGLGRIASINPAASDLLGVPHDRALGKPWQELLHLDTPGADAVLRGLADPASRSAVQLQIVHPHGAPRAMMAEIWTGGYGEPRTWILLSAPPATPESRDPLRRLGEAAACVSHQIRNSLHALEGFAGEIELELRARGGPARPTRHLLQALRNLGALSEDVLAIAGSPRSASHAVALHDVVASAARLARHPHVRVEIAAPPEDIWVHARRSGLVHALFNLIDNACRASAPDAPVRVTLATRGSCAVVEILDEGPGFAPVHGGGDAPDRRGRAGYGLIAARRFLEGDDARIEFERVPGAGTCCRVSLRLAGAPAEERADG